MLHHHHNQGTQCFHAKQIWKQYKISEDSLRSTEFITLMAKHLLMQNSWASGPINTALLIIFTDSH